MENVIFLNVLSNFQGNLISREDVYAYCCSLGMVLPVENDLGERNAIWTAVKQTAPPGGQCKYFRVIIILVFITICIVP
jgi:hypothetical protein